MLVSLSPTDNSMLASIVDAMRDPEKAKAFLDSLQGELAKIADERNALQARYSAAQADMEKWEVASKVAMSMKAESDAIYEKAKAQLVEAATKAEDAQEIHSRGLRDIADKQAALDATAKALAGRELAVIENEARISAKESEVARIEQQAKTDLAAARQVKAEYEDKLTKLKELV